MFPVYIFSQSVFQCLIQIFIKHLSPFVVCWWPLYPLFNFWMPRFCSCSILVFNSLASPADTNIVLAWCFLNLKFLHIFPQWHSLSTVVPVKVHWILVMFVPLSPLCWGFHPTPSTHFGRPWGYNLFVCVVVLHWKNSLVKPTR